MRARIRIGMSTDDGWAVPIVAMIIAFVTVLSVGGFALSSQALHESVVVQDESRAFQAANAGLDAAIARIPGGAATYQFGPAELGADTSAVVTVEGNSFAYKVTSTGYARRASNGQITQEQIITEFTRFDLYGMNVSAGGGGDMFSTGSVKGNSAVYGPFYTAGSINSARFEDGPLFVGGSIGISSSKFTNIHEAYVVGTGGTNTKAAHLYSTMPKLDIPAIDADGMRGWLDTAKAQSIDNKMGDWSDTVAEADATKATDLEKALTYNTVSGKQSFATLKGWGAANFPYYKYLGPASGLTLPLGEGTTNVVIDGSTATFGRCQTSPNIGTLGYDDFAWNAAEHVLYVNGTVFIDGAFTLNMPGEQVKYMGNGMIVANGPITISASQFGPLQGLDPGVSGGTTYSKQNFPANRCLGFVSPKAIYLTGSQGNSEKKREDDPDIAGAFYCPALVKFSNNLLVAGSVITDLMAGPGSGNNVHLRNSPNLKDNAPQGMPARNDGLMGITKWVRR
jgi:hypothetical protein